MPEPITGKTQPDVYVDPDGNQSKGSVGGDDIHIDKTDPNLTIEKSDAVEDDPYGAQKLLKDLTTSMQNIPKPANMTPDVVAQLVEEISIIFMQASTTLAQTVIKHDQKKQDIDADATNKKIADNTKKMEKLEKKEKLLKALKVGMLLTALLVSALTAGTASGLVAACAGTSFILTAVMAGLDMSGEMSKLAKSDPEAAEAIQIAVMILQMALAMAGLAAAIRAAAKASQEIADTAVQEGTNLAKTGAEGGGQVTGDTAGKITSAASEETTSKAVEDVVEDTVEDNNIAARNIKQIEDTPEGAKPEKLTIPEDPDGVDGVSETTGSSDKFAEQMERLATMIQRFASFLVFSTAGTNMAVQMQAAHIKKQVSDNDADLTEIKGDMKFASEMVKKWIHFLEELVKDNEKTFENTAHISKNVHQAQTDNIKASVLTTPNPSGTA